MTPENGGTETARDGFVLISVLIVTLLFVTISASMVMRSRVFILQERNRLESAALQAIVDGVARHAAFDLTRARFPLPTTGIRGTCNQEDIELSVAAVDQDMLLDLNGAPPQMIIDVLTAIGIAETQAKEIAAQIVDYRDPDDMTQPIYGAEAMEYQRAQLSWRPRNSFFVDASELAQLPALSPELSGRLAPLFTVDNPRAAIDPALIHRLYGRSSSMEKALGRWLLDSRKERFSVRIEARVKRGATASRLAIFSVAGHGGRPQFLKWGRPEVGNASFGKQDADPNGSRAAVCGWLAAARASAAR